MGKIVECRVKGVSTWEGNPEQDCIFETEHGWFSCKTNEIPWKVQRAVDTFGTVKAEVDPEPDADGRIQLIKFENN